MIGSVTKEPLELALRVLETHSLCDHCLGRQFGWLGTAMTNEERGRSMKLVLTLRADYKLRSGETAAGSQILRTLAGNGMFAPARELSRRNAIEFPAITECHICTISGISIFLRLQDMVTKCVDSLRGIEFDNFLVGSIPPPALAEREDELKASFGLIHGETLRSHINRELGKRLGEVINKPVEFRRPHVVLVYDVQNDSVNVQISPLFVSGRYRKLQRGIPQSRWDCKACRGKGCDECGHTGRRYPDSISEYIGEPIREASSGTSFKFHAAGREDVDALMLGDGRPFVVEVTEPRIRSLNLAEIATNINTRASGKIEVDHLEFSDRQQSQVLKMASSTNVKEYRALIEVEHELSDEALSLAESGLSGTVIEQRTPLRVLHRRSDRVRKKTIYEVRLVRQGGPRLEGFFKVQGGTYVKELISGDEGRTRPSVAELLGVKTRCVELSVVAIRDQDSDHNT